MISTTSRYAVRALVELARRPDGERVLAHDLATATEIPPNYLSKILVRLGKRGIVEASRGSHGGYRLRRQPDRLTLLEVVESFDGPQSEVERLLQPGNASSTSDTGAQYPQWAHLWEQYLGFLAGTSIGALARHLERAESPKSVADPDRSARQEEKRA